MKRKDGDGGAAAAEKAISVARQGSACTCKAGLLQTTAA